MYHLFLIVDSTSSKPNDNIGDRSTQSPEFIKLCKLQHFIINARHKCCYMQTASPSTRSLTLIDWKDIKGKRKRLQLKQLMCMKWKEIGCLLEIPLPVLQAWGTTYRENPLECINPVLSHWLDECNSSDYYPISWEGLQCLLEDAELSEVTAELKQALTSPS